MWVFLFLKKVSISAFPWIPFDGNVNGSSCYFICVAQIKRPLRNPSFLLGLVVAHPIKKGYAFHSLLLKEPLLSTSTSFSLKSTSVRQTSLLSKSKSKDKFILPVMKQGCFYIYYTCFESGSRGYALLLWRGHFI